jgi:hypothetical protein
VSTSTLSPVSQPSMLYPALSGAKPSHKHYVCPRCAGNNYSRLQVQIMRKKETVFGFACDACHNRWYVSSRLLLNEVFEEQCQKIYKFTSVTEKEFGALLVKTPEGIRMDMLDIGEDLSVTFKRTKEYRKDEYIVGTIHAHPISNTFSDWDIGTFLADEWEKISVVTGADSSINVMIRTPNTVTIPSNGIQGWVEDFKELDIVQKAEKFNFLLFKGRVNNLKLLAGVSNSPVTSLEKLLSQIE